MPTPAVSLKLRRFRQRFGIAAPRVVVRSHHSWQWYALPVCALVLFVAAVVWLVVQRHEAGAMGREIELLQLQLRGQEEELRHLRSTAGTGQNAVNIERAAQQQLLARMSDLERENAALKEDMLLFERLIPSEGEEPLVRIESLRVTDYSPSRYRYRLLLAFQPNKQKPVFKGDLELIVRYLLEGKVMQLSVPADGRTKADFKLEIKHFLRREGEFVLPSGAVLKELDAHVLQGGAIEAKRKIIF